MPTTAKAFNPDQDLYLPINCNGMSSDVLHERGLTNLTHEQLIADIASDELRHVTDVLFVNAFKKASDVVTEQIRSDVQQYIWAHLEDFTEPGSAEPAWIPEFANTIEFRAELTSFLEEEMSFGPDGERIRGYAA